MWIITPDYAASIVAADPARQDEADKTDYLVVRFRSVVDAEAFKKQSGFVGEILRTPEADYPVKIKASRDLVAYAIEDAVGSIFYPNFKDEVTRRRGQERHDTLLKVWADLLGIEDEEGALG